jgi:ubiquinone/menaquinone biosynthesis C-methylase UbiE
MNSHQPDGAPAVSELKGLRDDVYRRPLVTALHRLGLGPGWRCLDVGAGGGDVSVALAEMVGRDGRVYAVDSDPLSRDEVAHSAAAHTQVIALTQAGEDLILPEQVDLAFCRFLLLHVLDPAVVVRRMAAVVKPGAWVVAQEPITSAGRIDGDPMSMPDIPMSGRCSLRWCEMLGSRSSTPGPRRRRAWAPARWRAISSR